MINSGVRQIIRFFVLVILQVWLFNKIHLAGYATPLLYIYFIIKLPIDMNRNWVLVTSTLLGLSIDLFSYTLGLNTFACVIIGFLRYYLIKLFVPRDIPEGLSPSFSVFGKTMFSRYAATVTLIHQTVLFTTEAFTLFSISELLLRIGSSFALTLILIYAIESVNLQANKIK